MKYFFAFIMCVLVHPAWAEVPPPLTCLLRPDRSSDIGARSGGVVADVPVRRADAVKKGDLLVQLDDSVARAELAKATILRDTAQEKLSRAEAVTAGRVISAEEIANLRSDASIAEADFLRANLLVAHTKVLAPFDGTVAELMTEAGQLIGAAPLLRLINTKKLRAEIVFSAEAFGALKTGGILPLHVDLVGIDVDARIATIDNYLDATSNSFTVVAELDNSAGVIPAGTNCSLSDQ